jgi:CRISPR-associated DxTHG motif protein
MPRTFISFLGTNDYLDCNYYNPEQLDSCIDGVRFVQEATLRLQCNSWDENDQICIFTTDLAWSANWKDNGHLDRKTGNPKPSDGLEKRLLGLGLKPLIRQVAIPSGNTQAEIWEIFEKVYDTLRENDDLVFDVTHAFRSIPLLALVILNYAKVMKKIRLSGIYYGAFEVLGNPTEAIKIEPEKRNVPLLDLTALDQLLEWTFAVDRFLEAGDARHMHQLAAEIAREKLKGSKGKDPEAQALKRIANSLISFSRAMTTCRGMEITHAADALKNSLSYDGPFQSVHPLRPLFQKVRENIDPFGRGKVFDGIEAVRWCHDHNLIQQGYTILEEVILTGLLELAGERDSFSLNTRKVAAQALNILIKKIEYDEKKWEKEARENRSMTLNIHNILKTLEFEPLIKISDRISQLRNDLNHAGHNHNAIRLNKADEFKSTLLALINEIEVCFKPSFPKPLSLPLSQNLT